MAAPLVLDLTLTAPVGLASGDLMIAAIALTYTSGHGGIPFPACPGAVSVVTAPAGWVEVLADFPGGENAFGNLGGTGDECDRLAVFSRVAGGAEPANYVFDFTPGGATSAAGMIKAFTGTGGGIPSVHIAAAAVTLIAGGVANPVTCEAASLTSTVGETLLMAFFVARNGNNGTAFTVPAGMSDLTPAVNLQTTSGGTEALGLGVFIEEIALAGATGTRSCECDVDVAPPNLWLGMGYSLMIMGCGGAEPE